MELQLSEDWRLEGDQVAVSAQAMTVPLNEEDEDAPPREVTVLIPFICIADVAGQSIRGEFWTPAYEPEQAIALCRMHRAELEQWASNVYRRKGRPDPVQLLSTSYLDR